MILADDDDDSRIQLSKVVHRIIRSKTNLIINFKTGSIL
jgi:hypothetical protein